MGLSHIVVDPDPLDKRESILSGRRKASLKALEDMAVIDVLEDRLVIRIAFGKGGSGRPPKNKLHVSKKAVDQVTKAYFSDSYFTALQNPRDPSQRRHVPPHIPRPNYADDINGDAKYTRLGERRPRELESWEQEGMRRVCKLAREVLDHTATYIRPGVTTDELDAICHQACIDRNAYPSPLNYRNFPKSVCTSVNEVICHGIPDLRPLEEGDIVNLDVTLYFGGFHGDLNATYPVGKVDADTERLIRTARESLDAAIKLAKPGALFRDFGTVIEKVANQNNCSVNRTYCGHGINNLFHCAPNVPHYAKNKAPHYLKPGQTFTIEPMICLGRPEEMHWPDDWTAVTQDGKRSAQFEETLLVTADGVEILTGASAEKMAVNGSTIDKTVADIAKSVEQTTLGP
ncbi:MAG: Methionine aminopeptidase 1 [Cyphobasidiales sp. Tagirdzhanova-0007]|nr:MAG: Methionine aminopeptidase 1 [Cyphobasidiales sp. Tagirdzhanova-0007]